MQQPSRNRGVDRTPARWEERRCAPGLDEQGVSPALQVAFGALEGVLGRARLGSTPRSSYLCSTPGAQVVAPAVSVVGSSVGRKPPESPSETHPQKAVLLHLTRSQSLCRQ